LKLATQDQQLESQILFFSTPVQTAALISIRLGSSTKLLSIIEEGFLQGLKTTKSERKMTVPECES
jgi:hypothetical protein